MGKISFFILFGPPLRKNCSQGPEYIVFVLEINHFFSALAGTCIVLIVVHIIQLVLIPKITRQIRKYDRANDYDYDYD